MKFTSLVAVAAATLAVTAAQAASLQIAPTTISLPAGGGNATLYVINNGFEPIGVQVESFAWAQQGGGDALTPSPDIQVSPPMTKLKPGERQVIRVRVKAAGAGEQAYRLVANELPDAATAQRDRIQFRFNFSVPVFTGGTADDMPASGLAWNLSGGTLTVKNAGPTRAKLSALRLVGPSGEVPIADGNLIYVLSGATMQWQVSAPAGEVRIKGHDDRGGHDIEAAVTRS
jgi:fimbrial chaperone protein